MIKRYKDGRRVIPLKYMEVFFIKQKLPEMYASLQGKYFSISLEYPPAKYFKHWTTLLGLNLSLIHDTNDKDSSRYGIMLGVFILNLSVEITISNKNDTYPINKYLQLEVEE
jgi:hypothetical protein